MFLASAPELPVCDFTQERPNILGGEICRECYTRSLQRTAIEKDGLGDPDGLAMRIEEKGKVNWATG
jgi:hypothetical protein